MADIKRILRKRRWTGRELGILELTNMCELYRHGLEGVARPKPIVEPDRFQKMLDSIRGSEAGREYNGYLAIYEWLRLHNYIAIAHEQQAQLQILSMHNDLSNATIAETLFTYIDELPLIVTLKQYCDMRDEAREKELAGKEANLFQLVELAVTFLARQLTEHPEKRGNPLRALRKKLMAAPITSRMILDEYADVPEDLTQWEVISDTGLLEFYGTGIYTLTGEPEEREAIAQVKDFLAQFPEAAAAVVEDIRKKGLIPESFGEGLPASELWLEPLISLRDLYERDIYGMRDFIDADTTLFDGNKRALINGIAIVRSSDLLESSRIDKQGYYKPPQLTDGVKPLSLEAYFPDDEAGRKRRSDRAKDWEALASSYSLILGFNTALELIARIFDVPEVKIFRINIEALQSDITEVNELRRGLEMILTDTHAGDYFLKEKKLDVLREVFPPFDVSGIQIPEGNVAAAEDLMKDFRAFRGAGEDELRALLFYAGTNQAGAGKEEAHGR